MTAEDAPGPTISRYLGAVKDTEHAAVWRWLEAQLDAYPVDKYIAPLKPRRSRPRPRTFHGGQVLTPGDAVTGPGQLLVDTPKGTIQVQLGGDRPGCDDGEAIATALFTHKQRGAVTVFANGARRELHILLRRCWRRWVQLGYRVKPLGSGTELRYVVVSKDRHAWTLADFTALTGVEPGEGASTIVTLAGGVKPGVNFAQTVRLACEGYQEAVRGYFGVPVGLTVGSTAVGAMCKHVPDDAWVWRPCPALVAMCRAGGGYRGGHVHYPPYAGPVFKLDMRRAYTWALSGPLPVGAMQSRCVVDGAEQPGIYLCKITGPGEHPITIAEWQGVERGVVRRNWNGPEATAILCTDELEGIRALGYQVEPGYGFAWRRTFTLAGFTEQCEQLLRDHGERSAIGLVAKRLANAVYGKLAEKPIRMATVMAAEQPGPDFKPFLDAAGDEVDDVWCRWEKSYRPHQHVDLAAVVTARVRGALYRAISRLAWAGVRVLAADTDGLLVDRDWFGVLDADDGRPGSWRDEGYSLHETIAGPRFWTFRGTVRVAGTSPQSADVVAIALDRGVVQVEGKVMAPPWSDGAIDRDVTRKLRRGSG